jgi:phage antirepressor YoqD-like protein
LGDFTGPKALDFKLAYVEAFSQKEAELRAPARDPMQILNDPEARRGILLTYTEKMIALEGEVKELAPKADAYDRIASADGALCITDAAKALQMRPKDLFSYLQAHGWIYKCAGAAHYVGYQARVASGLLAYKVTTVLRADGSEKVVEQVLVTPKGITKLAALIKPLTLVA